MDPWNVKRVMSAMLSARLLRLAIIAIVAAGTIVWGSLHRYELLSRVTWFPVTEVRLRSEWPLTESEIRTFVPPLEGKSLLAVDGDQVMESIKARPWVAWVTLKKDFPNRLSIDVGAKRAQAIQVLEGTPYFVDENGERIESVTPAMMVALDLPLLSFERSPSVPAWNPRDVVRLVETFRRGLDSRVVLSQVALGNYPYFTVFLSRPRLEVAFSWENWESQLPILALLLHSPPPQIGQPQRINLVFPKKLLSAPIFPTKFTKGPAIYAVSKSLRNSHE